MKKFLSENKFIFVAIVITIILVITSFCVNFIRQKGIKDNIFDNNKTNYSLSQSDSQVTNQFPDKPSVSVSAVQKTDYLGEWGDLYGQRAHLEISDLGSYIRVIVNWSSSALENTKWVFECQYDSNNGNLICKNGEEIETYPVKNGIRMYGVVTVDGEDPDDIVEKTVKQNLQTTISIKKGNLRYALDKLDYYIGDKDEAMKSYQNMTLKINLPDLSENIFAK